MAFPVFRSLLCVQSCVEQISSFRYSLSVGQSDLFIKKYIKYAYNVDIEKGA